MVIQISVNVDGASITTPPQTQDSSLASTSKQIVQLSVKVIGNTIQPTNVVTLTQDLVKDVGTKITDLTDVLAPQPAEGDVLVYDATLHKYVSEPVENDLQIDGGTF